MEYWKEIKGYPNRFISSKGRIKSKVRKEKYLKFTDNGLGYLYVHISHNGIPKKKYVHRLVAETFIPNIENLPEVNHINGNKSDNSIDNLEWIDSRKNSHHYFSNKQSSSKYVGISFNKKTGYYHAEICINGIKKYCGSSKDEEIAYQMYKDELLKIELLKN